MIWALPCLQLYIYPCSPNHLDSAILKYFSSPNMLCFFGALCVLIYYLEPLSSTFLIILNLFFKTTNASLPPRSFAANMFTTIPNYIPSLKTIRKACVCYDSYYSALSFSAVWSASLYHTEIF